MASASSSLPEQDPSCPVCPECPSCAEPHSTGDPPGGNPALKSASEAFAQERQKLLPCCFSPSVYIGSSSAEYTSQLPGEGLFQCSATGMAFLTTGEADLLYRTSYWRDQWFHSTGTEPAGHLFDVHYPEGSVRQLHLPHCDVTAGDDLFVVSITDEGSILLKPRKVTETHVIVDVKQPACLGLVRRTSPANNPTYAHVQLFLRLRPLAIKVFLTPGNVPLDEVKAQHSETQHLEEAASACVLIPNEHYFLHCPTNRVQPEKGTYFLGYSPNHHYTFDVNLKKNTDDVSLELRAPGGNVVWQYRIDLKTLQDFAAAPQTQLVEPPSMRSPEAELLLSARRGFIERVEGEIIMRLLDTLFDEEIIDDPEMDRVTAPKGRCDRARVLIDMARRKGKKASLRLITSLLEEDPALHRELGLPEQP